MNAGEDVERLRVEVPDAIRKRVRVSIWTFDRVRASVLLAVLVLALALLLVGFAPSGTAGVAAAQDREQTPDGEGPPEHEHPDEVNDPADLASLQRWFGDRMGEIHVDCSEGIAVGDYDACEDLDEEYESYLERYVTVERERTTDESDRRGEEFEESRRQQEELAELLEEFNATYEEYQEAREAGDEERARELARELRTLADRIDELGGDLVVRFRELDGSTDADLERAADRTEEATEEVRTITLAVEQETLEASRLTLRSDDNASYAAPATVEGALRTEAETAISDAEVTIADGAGYRETVTTDENGSFRASYRPKRTGVGETELTAVYAPEGRSPYIGTNATTTVEVEPTNTSLEVAQATDTAAYGDEVSASGTLSAADEGPADVPVRLVVVGESLAADRTDADGSFAVAGTLPAAVPAGNVTLEVRGSEPGAALSPDAVTRPLEVAATGTALSAEVEYGGDGEAHVEGRLETADGDPVGGQPVTLTAGPETYATTTDDEGRYSFVIDRPASDREAVVTYAGTDTNLEPSRARVTLDSRSGEGVASVVADRAVRSFVADNPLLAALAGAVLVANAAIALAIAWRRRRGGESEGAAAAGDGFEGAEPAIRRVSESPRGLDAARTYLESAPSTAVQLAYASVRSVLASDDSRTHWEVYRDAKGSLDEDRREALRAVIEAFEAATFAPEGVDRERASRALEDAERCLTTADGGEPSEAAVPESGARDP